MKKHFIIITLAMLSTIVLSLGGCTPTVVTRGTGRPPTLEGQIQKLTGSAEFQSWSRRMSALLAQSPKREIYIVAD